MTGRGKRMIDILDQMAHFGLKKDPFGKAGHGDLFRGKKYQSALNLMHDWMRRGEMGALIGPPGSGKSTIINDLAARCQEAGDVRLVHVGHPGRITVSDVSIYGALLMEFAKDGLTLSSRSQIRFTELRAFLGDTMKGVHVGIILDECHRYRGEFLRVVKEFSEMHWGLRTDLLGVIFCGWPSFNTKIRTAAPDVYARLRVGRKVIQAADIMCAEIAEYLRHRARAAGNARLFSDGALNALGLTAGTPLKANAEAWDAMDAAFKQGSKTVQVEHVIGHMDTAAKKQLLGEGCTVRLIAAGTGLSKTLAGDILCGVKDRPDGLETIDNFLTNAIAAGGVENMKTPRKAAGA